MEVSRKSEALLILESRFSDRTFASFTEMEQATGMTRSEIIEMKLELQDRLGAGDRSISLTSGMHLDPPGFVLEVG